MKLISEALGKILVATVVVLMIFIFIGTVFIPKAKDFAFDSVSPEQNYIINNQNSDLFTLTCTKKVYELLTTDEKEDIDIFKDLTALSSSGEDLIPILKADYEKPMLEREHVFIYRISDEGSAILSPEIISTEVSDWTVIFVLNNGTERTTLKVGYMFLK